MIELKNVSFSYEDEEVLHNISTVFNDGEFCAVLGHNGSGKSTLAKLLNGILTPTSGEVIAYGMNTADDDKLFDIRKKVGMVFQNPDNQIVTAIVEDEVAFGAENLCLEPERIRRRVNEALLSVNLSRHHRRQTANLSGGEKQRLAIASVLVMHPKMIVFDESTAMLDPKGREDFMRIVNFLNKEKGMSVVLVTHFMDEAAMADRVLVLDNGSIVMDNTPKKVFCEWEKLQKYGLDIPQMTRLALELRELGLEVPYDVLSVEEMADILLKVRGADND